MERRLEVWRHTPVVAYKGRSSKDAVRRVAIYCRVSSLSEEQEESYSIQRMYYERIVAADPNLMLVGVYGDQGISGKSSRKRPEFQRMLRDCMSGDIDIVMCKSISRFARNLGDCLTYVRLLKQIGISVIFEREGINTAEERSELLLSILASIAQEEINSLSQNVLWANEKNNAIGNPTRCARFGYRMTKQPDGLCKWTINEQEARRVRLIIEQAAAGVVYKEIIAELEAMDRMENLSSNWRTYRIRSTILSEVYIGDLLTNKRYTADYLSGKLLKNKGNRSQYYIKGHHDPIVPECIWEAAKKNVMSGTLHSGRKAHKREDNVNDYTAVED